MNGTTRRRLTVAAVAVAVLVSASGCGNRSSEEDIARAAARLGSEAFPGATPLDPESNAAPVPVIDRPGAAAGAAPNAASPAATGGLAATPTPPGGAAPARPVTRATAPTTLPGPAAGDARQGTPAGPTGGSNAAPTGQAAPAGCSAVKPELVIGTVGTQSGPIGVATNPGVKAVQAWAANRNTRGGVDCHPVRYIVADDGGDPARHLALVKQLVETQHVIGFVFMNAVLSGQASVRYLNDKQVPVMADDGGGDWFNSPMHFPASSSGHGIADLTIAAGARTTIPAGLKKLAIIVCQEASVCTTYTDHWSKNAARLGYDIVYRGQASLGQPDYTSQCLAAQSAGAQVMMIAFEPNSVRRLRSSCTKVGFTAPIALVSVMSTADMAD